jgi:predicted ester cyclase
MSNESSVNLVLRYWNEVWNDGNLELLNDLFAPDLVAGRHFFISRTHQAFSDGLVTIDDVIARGDKVVVHYSWQAIHIGIWDLELAGIPMHVAPTGKSVWDRGIGIFQITDGKISSAWSEWTKLELAQ